MKLLLVVSLFLSFVCALGAHRMARRRGLNPAFWAALGFALGPLVFPALILARGKVDDAR